MKGNEYVQFNIAILGVLIALNMKNREDPKEGAVSVIFRQKKGT